MKKDEYLMLRVTTAEKKKIIAAAKKARMTLSDYQRLKLGITA